MPLVSEVSDVPLVYDVPQVSETLLVSDVPLRRYADNRDISELFENPNHGLYIIMGLTCPCNSVANCNTSNHKTH